MGERQSKVKAASSMYIFYQSQPYPYPRSITKSSFLIKLENNTVRLLNATDSSLFPRLALLSILLFFWLHFLVKESLSGLLNSVSVLLSFMIFADMAFRLMR